MSQHVAKKQKVSHEAEASETKVVEVPKTMKALVKNKPEEGYDYVTIDVPQPAKGELLIKVDCVSICGSDINLYKWNDVAKQIAKIPFTPGHEATGTVVKVGEEVFDFKIGSRICVENHYYCGKCYQCTHDLPHICQDMGQFGHGKKTPYGGFAEYTIVPAKFAYALKSDLDPKLACLLEPFGVAQHACEEVEVKGDTVLIVGCGPIGLCSVAVAKAMGASKIIACDVVEEKLAIAKKMGADIVFNSGKEDVPTRVKSETKGDGAGALVECSGAPTFDNFFRSLRKGGRILMLGLPKVPIQVNTPLPDFIFKSITLKTIHGRKIFHTWEESEKMLASKKVDITPIISHDLPMSKFNEAHRTLIKGEGCKILVNPHA